MGRNGTGTGPGYGMGWDTERNGTGHGTETQVTGQRMGRRPGHGARDVTLLNGRGWAGALQYRGIWRMWPFNLSSLCWGL